MGHLLGIVPTNCTHCFLLANAGILSRAPAQGDNAAIGLDWVSVDQWTETVRTHEQIIGLGTETGFEH